MVEAACACFNRRRALIGSWVMPPTTGVIEIKKGNGKNITIATAAVAGIVVAAATAAVTTAATAEAEKATAALAAAGPMTMETMKTTTAVMADAKATTS